MKAPHRVTCRKSHAVEVLERVAKFGEHQHGLTDASQKTQQARFDSCRAAFSATETIAESHLRS